MTPYAPVLLIVADDLSGAADTAAAFAHRAGTAVLLDPGARPAGATVVAVDTDSRYLPPGEAAARVTRALAGYGPGTRVYKKIDSTLRGAVGPEVRACLSALRDRDGVRPLAVVAPAFPATGRMVVGGRVLVDGVPLEDVRPGHVPLAEQLASAGLAVESLGLDALRRGDGARLLAEASRRADAVVVDAVTDADLARVLPATADLPVLLVGSGGLAHHLALPEVAGPEPGPETAGQDPTPGAVGHGPAPEVAGSAPDPETGTPPPASGPAGTGPPRTPPPLLICVGSRTAQARSQRRALIDRLPAVAVTVGTGPGAPLAAGRALRAALLAGHHVVLSPDPREEVRPARAGQFAHALAEAAAGGLPLAGALIATGGETARAVLRAAGAGSLAVQGEPAPGVVRMRTPGGLTVVTKAGAFGTEDTLLNAARALLDRPCTAAEGTGPAAAGAGSVPS
ncbi:four-carbon acid sugar kinase family protein [Streptomyces sp. TS71-3]|uniref:four-carbon acid sugar kinase family protein n=1 Tax=Streptomyces sp. TS71-3 TaxID=2733862 RepID=UPI001B2888B9|nr:four-carbon acid sugar kinase family protein [Streptomyces sp. TS71-3]GHJ42065.1 hypothetical protein Sm713_76740 [Streptomyces sp. TS71-3]